VTSGPAPTTSTACTHSGTSTWTTTCSSATALTARAASSTRILTAVRGRCSTAASWSTRRQKTDARQSNRNLLLSAAALVQSNPQLEILANDVRCTHGSTIGRLDEEAVFYLRSRGIDRAAAESLLTWAFATEVVDRIRVPQLRDRLREAVLARLPGSGQIEEGCDRGKRAAALDGPRARLPGAPPEVNGRLALPDNAATTRSRRRCWRRRHFTGTTANVHRYTLSAHRVAYERPHRVKRHPPATAAIVHPAAPLRLSTGRLSFRPPASARATRSRFGHGAPPTSCPGSRCARSGAALR
jgi:hypothetical protein